MKKISYNKKSIAEITGLIDRQVQFYTEQGVITPEIDLGQGRGKTRLYSSHNLFQFGIIKELVDFGLTVHKVKFIIEFLDTTAYREFPGVFDSGSQPNIYLKFFPSDNYRVELSSLGEEDNVLKITELIGISSCFVINLREVHSRLKR